MSNSKRGDQSSWINDASLESVDKITLNHLAKFYGITSTAGKPYCPNRYSPRVSVEKKTRCTNSRCKENPNCLNHLGQEYWEREDSFERYCQIKGLSTTHAGVRTRTEGNPVGLKNLGATCYVNSLLQVWFYNLNIRKGIYEFEHKEQRNPICFQLQRAFAFLEYGHQDTYDPVQFVEALELNADEEQDVQEFSKLFTALLNSIFETQEKVNLRNLFKDQFEGEYEYGTKCSKCKRISQRREMFHELELNIKDNSSLEQCVERFLKPETMKGEDQYFCSECDSKQNATRTTRISRLPNVLNVQLMRFVYDTKTFTKKKNTARIRFPRALDARMLLDSSPRRRRSSAVEFIKGASLDRKRKRFAKDGDHHPKAVVKSEPSGSGLETEEFVNITDVDDSPGSPATSTLGENIIDVTTLDEDVAQEPRSDVVHDPDASESADQAIDVGTEALSQPNSPVPSSSEPSSAFLPPKRPSNGSTQTPKPEEGEAQSTDPIDGSKSDQSDKGPRKPSKESEMAPSPDGETQKGAVPSESAAESDSSYVYDLTAVLTHEGPSAYSGHYSAYVFNAGKQCWFKFDDEKVTNEGPILNLQTPNETKSKRKRSTGAEKAKTDDDTADLTEGEGDYCSSRDAYMLIYTKRKMVEPQMAQPMDAIMQEVQQVNHLTHRQAHAQSKSLLSAREEFDRERESRRVIYSAWHVTDEAEYSYFFPKSLLQDWVCGPFGQAEESKSSSPEGSPSAPATMACAHGNLSPYQMKSVKRVNKVCGELLTQQHSDWEQVFSTDQLCRDCAFQFLKERRYHIQHLKDVQEFEKALKAKSEVQYLISKAWVKEWCKKAPEFDWEDISSDPFPEYGPYGLDVRCTHGGVSLDLSNCRQIPQKAVEVLVRLFPHYEPPREFGPPCEKCVMEQGCGKPSSAKVLKEAEDERNECRHLVIQSRKELATLSEPSYYVIDNAFIQEWRSFVRNPGSKPRPEKFDNSFLFCQHGKLHYDFSDPIDQPVLNNLSFLTDSEWAVFQSHYAGGPEVQFKKPIVEDQVVYETIPDVCPECVVNRRLDFQEAVIHICRKEEANHSESPEEGKSKRRPTPGTRASQRSKSNIRARITVRKDDTVKDIKVKIMDKLNINPLYQRLYFLDQELVDNGVSVRELGVLPNSQIFLSEIEPMDEDEETWEDQIAKGEETGFKGTSLLA
ncbi:cysteine proteinase [Basidiobolus meristosporus CBS 931.73]|uniref:ubiquitinyl hydrolase 1 n=1 Tax=Basidiobolus meristosporus CBS 931.73 TaxID=1314790 RepID=A0A1Y1Z6V8_9FUNG|nr:cysteine proteinase [Basidiobolus meristosporus CBS 931.73]|eukprot:ORY05993.1 cysteine proteinase [Basidiobolus meristosporus CBS 931.73]